ncbi:hypothetical protein [Aliikangiella maris]|uniref:Uncharacterized protein n=2 Tax=Aliikangiella maris TaxID=3162458 RepID=A0ABV3MJI3_9GAMM
MTDLKTCELCSRQLPLTFHHLIPKSCHTNKWFKKHYTAFEMKHNGINICRSCHNYIHKRFTEKQLGRDLNTLEALLQQPEMVKYIQWAKKQH